MTNKTNLKVWNNSRGEGKVFSVDLLDETVCVLCPVMLCHLTFVHSVEARMRSELLHSMN